MLALDSGVEITGETAGRDRGSAERGVKQKAYIVWLLTLCLSLKQARLDD